MGIFKYLFSIFGYVKQIDNFCPPNFNDYLILQSKVKLSIEQISYIRDGFISVCGNHVFIIDNDLEIKYVLSCEKILAI